MKKLTPIHLEKIWGYEDWLASTHPVACQKELENFVGGDYPLLVKIIQANSRLSVQIHPDDERASMFEHCRGKTEGWYVLSAEKGAQIVYGLNGIYTASELRKAIEINSLEDCLRYVEVHAGDFVYVPSGTVHALLGGVQVLEVQQSSDVTYRFYDWGRGRECHVEKAIASIKTDAVRSVNRFQGVFSCPYFTLEEITVENEYNSFVDKASSHILPDDYNLIFVKAGHGILNGEAVSEKDIFVLSPAEKITAKGEMQLMKIIPVQIKHR